jgi:hypothetical protein
VKAHQSLTIDSQRYRDKNKRRPEGQADRNSPVNFFAPNSARWGETEVVLTDSLRVAAVRLHNQNMKSTAVNPNDNHPNKKICSQCIFSIPS